jgi:hypothetical protein
VTEGRGRFAAVLVTLEALLCLCALGGAIYFFARQQDAMPSDILARTPFGSWVWPGVLLALIVGVPSAVVAVAAMARKPWAHAGHAIVGALLMGWIIVQVAFVGFIAGLQPLMFLWGLVIVLLGAANHRQWHRTGYGTGAHRVV